MALPLVSVIVPVYRAQAYLARCLDSIVGQTYPNLEILLVDDGSPDACGAICDDYAARDARIRVFHLENGGVARARNVALDAMTGAYVIFVDADDYNAPELVEKALQTARERSADIVVFDFWNIEKDGLQLMTQCYHPGDVGIEKMRELILKDELLSYMWNKFFRASLFEGIRIASVRTFSDLLVMPRIFMQAKSAVYVRTPYYYYNLLNDGSLTSIKSVSNKQNAKNRYGMFRAWEERERVARECCESVVEYSERRAVNSAISTRVIDLYRPALSEEETERLGRFLEDKKRNRVSRIDAKYRTLWWLSDHCPLLCRLYGYLSVKLFQWKLALKERIA